ncbi:hypothetical protein [Polaromonas jejuensis]|uniref:Uncharacterized protein n=1 Tax=Polaromonas jejuensis TaxID=457502 RepID=A0ABW0QIL1_9BURK|nr:hypothetical protein [Polaromonas jejuensis]
MQLFHESLNDALREVVAACSGPKQVAAKLWPEKTPDAAHRLLLDCLNETRAERLDPDRLRMLLKLGRNAGCHAAMNYLLRDLGYEDCRPLEPQDEQAALMRDYIAATKALQGIASRLETRFAGGVA